MKGTRKQMIDFLNGHYRYKGRKLPKNRLALLTDDQLRDLISSDPRGDARFQQYLETDEGIPQKKKVAKKLTPPLAPSEEREKRFEDLVDVVVQMPSFTIASLELKLFLTSLPFGCVTNEKLLEQAKRLEDIAPLTAISIMEYASKQEQHILRYKEQQTLSE